MTEPEIQKANGNTYVSASVYWQTPLRCLGMFNSACMKLYEQYKRKMTIRSLREAWGEPGEADCTRSLETLCVAASLKVQIRVEGDDEISEMLARQVYSGLSSPDCWEFSMQKYDKK